MALNQKCADFKKQRERIGEIMLKSLFIEAEDEVEDAFSYTSGHYTRNTGTKAVTISLPAADAVELEAILKRETKQPEFNDGKRCICPKRKPGAWGVCKRCGGE